MAKKPTITTVSSGYQGTGTINSNFQALRDAFDNTISRDGSTPNTMNADLDMNSNDLLNVDGLYSDRLIVNGVDINTLDLQNASANAVSAANSAALASARADDISAVAGYRDFANISSLISNTTLTYIPGYDGTIDNGTGINFNFIEDLFSVVTSEVIRTREEGYSFEVAASDATDHDLITAGGVKLYVIQNETGFFLKSFNAVGDGSTNDSGAFTKARDAAALRDKTIVVPAGNYLNGKPSGKANTSILWNYVDGGDADNVLLSDGTRGGLFADYECKAGQVLVYQDMESQTGVSGGGFRDALFINYIDSDTNNYTAIGQKVSHGLRVAVQGAHNGTAYQNQTKDLIGAYFSASGAISWTDRGCSAITSDAYQFGEGIASNEFAVHNPGPAGGGIAHSRSMAAVQAIVRSLYGDEDATHFARGVLVSNLGKRITSGFEIISSGTGGESGHYKYGLHMRNATVTGAAIIMPLSSTGNVGTVIDYDSNDYTVFDRANNRYIWVVAGATPFFVGQTGVGVNAVPVSTSQVTISPSTSSLSHLLLSPGTTPSAPTNGELWFDGTNLKIVAGGVTKTLAYV